MSARLYVVIGPDKTEHLVNAANPAAAVYHVARVSLFSAKAAKAAEVARLMAAGVKVQEASAE